MLLIENAHRKLRLLSKELSELRVKRTLNAMLDQKAAEDNGSTPNNMENNQMEESLMITSDSSLINENFVETKEQNMEVNMMLKEDKCDLMEYNNICVVNTEINESSFNGENSAHETSDTLNNKFLDLTFLEQEDTKSSTSSSNFLENFQLKKDKNVESDGNLIEQELGPELVPILEIIQNTELEPKPESETVPDPLEVLEARLLAAYEEAERNIIADQIILNRLNPANVADRLNFHQNPVLFNYLLQCIRRLYYGPVLALAPILPNGGVVHMHIDVRADADAGNDNVDNNNNNNNNNNDNVDNNDNNNVDNNGNDNRVVVQVEIVGNVPAPLGSTYIERVTLIIFLWLLFGLLLFSRLIPVYLVRGILHIFDQKDAFFYLIRRICEEFDLGSAHLVLPLTFESLNFWSRCSFYIEFVIGLSIITTVSSWAGE